MKLRRFSPLALVLLVIPLGGADCELINNLLNPPTDDGGVTEPEGCVDDNYSVDTAGTLTPGMAVSELLCPLRDNDYWAFDVVGSGKLIRVHLWMDTNLTPVEPGYTILTADDIPVGLAGQHEGRTPGEPVNFEGLHPIAEGSYVLKIADVEGFDDRFDDTNEYHLEIEILDNPDPSEPNERPDEATPLTLDAVNTGLIGTTGDQDWFAVPVEADAQLMDLQLRAPADIGLSLRVEIVDPTGLTIVDSRPAIDTGVEFSARTRRAVSGAPGTVYYVHIFDENDQANADTDTGTYELVVSVNPDPDVNEQNGGNDLPQNATPLAADTAGTGTLASIGDQDIFEVAVPAGTSAANPRVLVIDVTFSGGVPADIQPQLRVLTANPERDGPFPPCDLDCAVCVDLEGGATGCGEAYLQRVLNEPTYRGAFPLRRSRGTYIALNDFGDDGYLDGNDYTVSYTIVDDTDPGEVGDDYLVPNLQTAAYDNLEELEAQFDASRDRARNINVPFQAACEPPAFSVVDGGVVFDIPPDPCADAGTPDPDAGADGGAGCVPPPPPNCQEVVPVPDFQGSPMEPYTVTCNGQDWTVNASGRLTYEGDRDFFTFNVPDVGYWGMDVEYDVSTTTPVELTVFVHDSEKLVGAFLEAQETQGNCVTSTDCPSGSVCIDEKCWADNDNNAAFNNHIFPNPGQCLYVHTNFTERPMFIEVTDNGLNDFDLDMEYTIRLRIRCGCPSDCDDTGPAPQCQGVGPPQ